MAFFTRRLVLGGATTLIAQAAMRKASASDADTDVLQTVTAYSKGVELPSSTGQIVSRALAEEVIATNKSLAANLGYTVNPDGSFTDPTTQITILLSYVPAAPFYDIPPHPMCGGPPPMPNSVTPDTFDAQTAKVFVWGQSHAANAGRGRFTAVSPKTWVYNNGLYYPCSDPIIGAEGTDGSVWSRFADAAIGRTYNGSPVTRVVIGNCASGSTSINDWAPGGSKHSRLRLHLTDFMHNVGLPTHLCFSQGGTDVGQMTLLQWHNQWLAMLKDVRDNLGCNSKIFTSIEASGNLRTADDPADKDVINRTPDSYIFLEKGRSTIRAAQASVQNLNASVGAGPNLDQIDWRLRAYGDGLHFGELGLTAAGHAWAEALFP
jgi:hypothetical protein